MLIFILLLMDNGSMH